MRFIYFKFMPDVKIRRDRRFVMSIGKYSFSATSLASLRSRFGCRLGISRLAVHPKVKSSIPIILLLIGLLMMASTGPLVQAADTIDDATVAGDNDEVTTNYLKGVLGDQNVWVFDARPTDEYAMSHIPGALNVAQKPGTPTSEYISDACEIERIVGEDNKDAQIILYCNGPFCGKTKRLEADLAAQVDQDHPCAGFTNVWRYQAGAPVWRALVGTMQIEASAVLEVRKKDKTARIYDARPDTGKHRGIKIPHLIVLPVDEVTAAKDDGRLPMEDHNTRIICFGESGSQAKALADQIAKNAFHNVTFFNGTAEEFRKAYQRGAL
jgi:rhodanese-related sulfurtransferase